MNDKLVAQLKRHEGFRSNFYLCSAGKKTIGYGRNVDANPLFLGSPICEPVSPEIAEDILIADIDSTILLLESKWEFFSECAESPRRDVLINLGFNIGINKFLQFKRLMAAVEKSDWTAAANSLKNSKWYSQVGRRSIELVAQMESGQYSF